MRTCTTCRVINEEYNKFCLACGANMDAGMVAQAAAVDDSTTAGSVTVRIHVKCNHCATPVPVNAPVERVRCGACLRESDLPGLASTLKDASLGMRVLGSPYGVVIADRPGADCGGCGELVDVEAWAREPKAGVVPCTRCGAGVPSWAAPAWLRAALPNVGFVLGGDPKALPPEAGVAIEVQQTSAQPIAMACPQCGGGLTITADDERTIDCRFCNVAVFLPDELWRRLHPVATMRTWTLTYTGRALLDSVEFAAREQVRRDVAARAAQPAPAPEPIDDEPAPPQRSSINLALAVVIVAVAMGVAILVLVS